MPLSLICTCWSTKAGCAHTKRCWLAAPRKVDLWAQTMAGAGGGPSLFPKRTGKYIWMFGQWHSQRHLKWHLFQHSLGDSSRTATPNKACCSALTQNSRWYKNHAVQSIKQQEQTPPPSVIPAPPGKSAPWTRQLPTDRSSVLWEAAGTATRKRKQVFVQLEWGKKQNKTTNTKLRVCLNH